MDASIGYVPRAARSFACAFLMVTGPWLPGTASAAALPPASSPGEQQVTRRIVQTGSAAWSGGRATPAIQLAQARNGAAAAVSAPAGTASSPTSPSPRPGAVAAEAAHGKRYDAAIAPVRDYAVSGADVAGLKQAISRAAASDDAAARSARDALSDPLARKLVDWYRLRTGLGAVAEYRSFLAANPQWPNRSLMVRRMEEAVFRQAAAPAEVKALFKDAPPQSAAGHAALASAYLAAGDRAAAARHAGLSWRDLDLPASLEPIVLERLGKLLGPADHKWRLDRLLIDDVRWRSQRAARAAVARRVLPLLSAAERKKATARLAVFLRSSNAGKLLAGLPDSGPPKAGTKGQDWGLEFHRIQHLRRSRRTTDAARRLIAASLDKQDIVAPDEWWVERRAVAYDLLHADKPRLAYDVVKAAGPLSVNPQKDQAFHAGWLALRYLKNAKAAERHFAEMRSTADGPLTKAKSAYWLGRALEAQGRVEANTHYRDAARFADTFHGQLSRAKLGGSHTSLVVSVPAAPTAEEIAAFRASEIARAAVIADRAGLGRGIARTMLARLQLNAKAEAPIAMAAHLSKALGDTQMSVRIGKAGVARGFNLISYSYPVRAFPAFEPLRAPPEMALLLGIARQESEFNTNTKSGAGARGILQVMPITARHVCRDYKIKCNIARLMKDESYNATLASAYIGDRMAEFRGSYVLGIAGYNAGPGRARQWVREFGDPRDPQVDVIDWIHRIPFEETRNYVQKVLSNVQVYRARLAPGPVGIAVMSDLERARDRAAKSPPAGGSATQRRAGAAD